jgi:hypothetical protein
MRAAFFGEGEVLKWEVNVSRGIVLSMLDCHRKASIGVIYFLAPYK